jgi:hypothetical protein
LLLVPSAFTYTTGQAHRGACMKPAVEPGATRWCATPGGSCWGS